MNFFSNVTLSKSGPGKKNLGSLDPLVQIERDDSLASKEMIECCTRLLQSAASIRHLGSVRQLNLDISWFAWWTGCTVAMSTLFVFCPIFRNIIKLSRERDWTDERTLDPREPPRGDQVLRGHPRRRHLRALELEGRPRRLNCKWSCFRQYFLVVLKLILSGVADNQTNLKLRSENIMLT